MSRFFIVLALAMALGGGYFLFAPNAVSEPNPGNAGSSASTTSEPVPTLVPLRDVATTTQDQTPATSAPSSLEGDGDQPTSTLAPSAGEELDESHGDVVPPGEPAQPRDPAQRRRFTAYEDLAAEFMAAFARPDKTEEADWWPTVRPYLSARVREDYRSVAPSRVPFTKVTGPARVMPTDAPSDLLMVVLVPTDAGDYTVETETDEDGIHVTRVVPPTSEGVP